MYAYRHTKSISLITMRRLTCKSWKLAYPHKRPTPFCWQYWIAHSSVRVASRSQRPGPRAASAALTRTIYSRVAQGLCLASECMTNAQFPQASALKTVWNWQRLRVEWKHLSLNCYFRYLLKNNAIRLNLFTITYSIWGCACSTIGKDLCGACTEGRTVRLCKHHITHNSVEFFTQGRYHELVSRILPRSDT